MSMSPWSSKMIWPLRHGLFAALLLLFATAISEAAYAQDQAACTVNKTVSTIKGVYVDNYGGLQNISETFWDFTDAVFEVCSVDNATKRIIAMNNNRNVYDPGKFSRFEWTTAGNRLWFCQIVYDAPTAAAAAAATPA